MAKLFSRRAKKSLPQKTLGYYDLMGAFRQPACPLCYLLRKKENRAIQMLFYEKVNDPSLRQKLRQSGGFCPEHTRVYLQVGDKLGQAIVAEDVVSHWVEHLSDVDKEFPCLLCTERQEMEKRIVTDFVQFLQFREFTREMQQSVGLCQAHFTQILRKIKEPASKNLLLQFQSQKLVVHLRKIQQFIRKNDYRFQNHPVKKEEVEAVTLLWHLLQKTNFPKSVS